MHAQFVATFYLPNYQGRLRAACGGEHRLSAPVRGAKPLLGGTHARRGELAEDLRICYLVELRASFAIREAVNVSCFQFLRLLCLKPSRWRGGSFALNLCVLPHHVYGDQGFGEREDRFEAEYVCRMVC